MFKGFISIIGFIVGIFGLIFIFDAINPQGFSDYVIFLVSAIVVFFAVTTVVGLFTSINNTVENINISFKNEDI